MESEGPEALGSQLAALQARLNALADEQRAAIQSLREQIAGIEAQLPSRKTVVPEPVKPESVPVVEEPKPVIVPPPLPVAVKAPVTVKPTPPPVVEKDEGFEMQLGRVWLVRFGVVLLLTGLVLLGNFAYRNWIREMPNGVRLFGLFLCAGALVETGRRLVAGTSLKKPGEVILAGGLSFFYYCTFASHHVARLKVIDSPVLAAVFLLGAAGLIVGVSLARNAKATAVLGLLLASYSTILQPLGWLSCVSNVVLAGAGLALMLRPGWS
ncbi:MAG TPA: hypothetical protein VM511_03325, partial [Luteolibacter sp.]|nr:hypothetical protein [Luteolibacter sp.]